MNMFNSLNSRTSLMVTAFSALFALNASAQAPATAPTAAQALTNQIAKPSFQARPSWAEKLTEEQKKAYREARETAQTQTKDVNEKMRTARRELQQQIYADKVDEAKLREKASAIGKLEGELAVIQATSFGKYRQFLPPEQIERMKGVSSRLTNRLDALSPRRIGTNSPVRPAPPAQ